MLFLIASLAVLAVGPLSYRIAARAPWALRILDAVVVASVGALVLLHILPETLEKVGWPAFVPLVVGLLGPSLLERTLSRLERGAHHLLVLLVIGGLGLHALTDGVALALPIHEESLLGFSLPVAVVLHRIPVSLLIWWLLRPSYGTWAAVAALAVEGLGAVVGYAAAHLLVPHIDSPILSLVQSFVAGSMLHVAVDRRDYDRTRAAPTH